MPFFTGVVSQRRSHEVPRRPDQEPAAHQLSHHGARGGVFPGSATRRMPAFPLLPRMRRPGPQARLFSVEPTPEGARVRLTSAELTARFLAPDPPLPRLEWRGDAPLLRRGAGGLAWCTRRSRPRWRRVEREEHGARTAHFRLGSSPPLAGAGSSAKRTRRRASGRGGARRPQSGPTMRSTVSGCARRPWIGARVTGTATVGRSATARTVRRYLSLLERGSQRRLRPRQGSDLHHNAGVSRGGRRRLPPGIPRHDIRRVDHSQREYFDAICRRALPGRT